MSGYAGAVDLDKRPEEQYKLEISRPLFSTFYGGEMYNVINPGRQEYILVSLAKFKQTKFPDVKFPLHKSGQICLPLMEWGYVV